MSITSADVDGAAQQLADTGTRDIDRRIILELLQGHPELALTAREWGWCDTVVRDDLFVLLWCHLTGGHPDEQVGESERNEQIQSGQKAWLDRNGAAPYVDSYDPGALVPKVGSEWIWELGRPHAECRIRVDEVRWNGEEWWVRTEALTRAPHQTAGVCFNDASRFAEAVTPVGGARWTTHTVRQGVAASFGAP